MVPIFLVLLALTCLPAAAQESGWVDSVGYRQQNLRTAAILQVAYSPNGKILYSVSADSIWHINRWDAETGILLNSTTIDKTLYDKLFSVIIATDTRTYAICGSQSDKTYHTRIYSLESDSLLYDVTPDVADAYDVYSAVFDSEKKLLWVFYRIRIGDITYSGNIKQYKLNAGNIELLRSEKGAVRNWSLCAGNDIFAWVGYSISGKFDAIHGITNVARTMNAFIWADSITRKTGLVYEPMEYEFYDSKIANCYHPIITPNRLHYLFIDHSTVSRWSLIPYAHTSDIQIPFIPTFSAVSPSNTHVLLSSGRQIALYHITSNLITDSLILPKDSHNAAFRPNSTSAVLGSYDGYLRLISLALSPPNIPNDFRVDRTKTYTDSSLIFSVTTSKIIAHYKWDFGDGTTGDSTETALHRYMTTGNYTVRLLLTDTSGITDTIIKQSFITILPHLVPAFSATPRFGMAPLDVQFTDKSQGAVTSWKWDFGDKQKDSVQHPKHTFTGRRYYNVSLTIGDGLTTATLVRNVFITADTIPTDTFTVMKKWGSTAKNSVSDSYSQITENAFTKGLLGTDGKIYLYDWDCYSTASKQIPGPPVEPFRTYYYKQGIWALDSLQGKWDNIINWSPPSQAHPGYKCSGSGSQIIRYRDGQFITSFVAWIFVGYGNPVASTLYFSSGRTFAPSGWTHNFDGAFLPDGTDIFLFRNGNTSSLQFFRQDSVLIARDSLVGDVMRPFAIADSQRVLVISNPYIGTGDSSRWLLVRSYFADGRLIEERQKFIEKGRYIRLLDAANLGNGEFLICGRGSQPNATGGTDTMAYLAKISASGRFIWEYLTPTWKQFQILQKVNPEYYCVSGQPYSGFYQGFTAFRTDGTILSDNRLGGISSSFGLADFVVGKWGNELWFIGADNVPNQGLRDIAYLCNNPMETLTGVEATPTSFSDKLSAEVFPLPATKEITVRVSVPHQGRLRLSVVSSLGVEQFQTERETNIENAFHIPTDGLPAGIYGIQIRLNEEMLTVPAIILR